MRRRPGQRHPGRPGPRPRLRRFGRGRSTFDGEGQGDSPDPVTSRVNAPLTRVNASIEMGAGRARVSRHPPLAAGRG